MQVVEVTIVRAFDRLGRALLLASLLGLGLPTLVGGCGADEPSPTEAPPFASEPGGQTVVEATALGIQAGASARSGMGAQVYPGGTMFRVWAPNASRVAVKGDFNGWTETELPSEGNGNFSVDVAGAVAGQHYEYLIQNGAMTVTRADPRARQMTNSVGTSVIVDPAAYAWTTPPFQAPPWNEQIIYELHIGTFNRASAGDNGACGTPGTFASAIEKLDHLVELGVNMIELMPPAEFPGDCSWGYNPSFPFAPEGVYGGPGELRAFVDQAHARGLGVIVDVVHNHWGPTDLTMWDFDGTSYGVGGIYFYTDGRQKTPWGDTRPDYGRPQVRDYIVDSAMSWLDEYRADGLRWDSTVAIRSQDGRDLADGWRVMQRANNAVTQARPGKLMIAEDLQGNDWITRPTSSGGAGFGSQWDARFFHPIDDNLIKVNDADRDMGAIAAAIGSLYNGQATQRVIYTESHDEVANGKSRIPEMIWPGNARSYPSRKRSTLGAAIVLTAPGIPMLFQGQEFLEDGYFKDTRPLDWSKSQTYSQIQSMYRDLIQLRRNAQGSTRGLQGNNVNVFHRNDGAKVIAYHRWDRGGAGDDVVVLANFSARAFPSYRIGLPRGGVWKVRFNGDSTRYSDDFQNTPANDLQATGGNRDGLGFSGTVGVGPYSVVILSQ